MKVLITGKEGQLGRELATMVPRTVNATFLSKKELDISDYQNVAAMLEKYAPDMVINTAAYTAVDQAESNQTQAYQANHIGAKNVALICNERNIRLLHVSTDFVFDGNKSSPYEPEDKIDPQSVYGASKAAGEQAITEVHSNSVIVRTAWVYSCFGNNFVKTMLKLMKTKNELNVVHDQIGTPTWTNGLAKWIWAVAADNKIRGIYHWTDAGVASWYDFAVAIQEIGLEQGILSRTIAISPIKSEQYPTPAKRPSYSVLDKSSAEVVSQLKCQHWRHQLTRMLRDYRNSVE